MTVTDRHIPYGEEVFIKLSDAGIRVERDFRNEKLGYKIREAQIQKIPYMLVIGDREMESNQVSPRERSGKDLGAIGVNEFSGLVKEKCAQYQ
jgi:threonyl-tRNA synthetase